MTDRHKHIVLRFAALYLAILLLFVAVVYKIFKIQVAEADNWKELAKQQSAKDIVIKARRGNIYAADGRLLASSIPAYKVFMDMKAENLTDNGGKVFHENVDSLAWYLSNYFKDRSQAAYKRELTQAFRKGSRRHPVIRREINYSQYKDIQAFPLFKLGRYRGGVYTEERVRRVKPFGSLASRTIGNVYAEEEKGGVSGIEASFNEYLVGTPGLSKRKKIAYAHIAPVEVEAINGLDIYSTIDIEIQDIAERALRDTIGLMEAEAGCIVVMEVKTGEIKAMVNLDRDKHSGRYYENINHALSNRMEPGSTFKVASLIAVLDEGKVKIDDVIDIEGGIVKVAGKDMKDHNYNSGKGFDKLKVNEIIQASSNVGTSKIVMQTFGNKPEKFINKLYDMKLNDPLPLQMKGAATSWIKHPKKDKRQWYGTSLAWMSIGYETIMPPIYTLTFYNAIANNGKMVSPLFVKHIKRNESIVESYQTQVLKESICKPSTLQDVQQTLIEVIEGEYATARSAKSDMVRIAGKTGTAQILGEQAKNESAKIRHNVSFCGYFPADNPRYSAIVVISKPKGIPSGGRMAGSIFKKMAEKIILNESSWTVEQIVKDSANHQTYLPQSYCGYATALQKVNAELQLPIDEKRGWVLQDTTETNRLALSTYSIVKDKVPDVTNMGAKDAFYLLSKLGLNVTMHGSGKVYAQSIKPLSDLQMGKTIVLNLK